MARVLLRFSSKVSKSLLGDFAREIHFEIGFPGTDSLNVSEGLIWTCFAIRYSSSDGMEERRETTAA